MSEISTPLTENGAPQTPLQILIVDDDEGVLHSGRFLMEGEGWKTETARTPSEALRRARKTEFDVALIDMNYSRNTTRGEEGMELLSQLMELDPELPILMMTAWGTIDLAVEAMQRGARDFIQKPWDNQRVLARVAKHGQLGRALRAGRLLAEENRLLREEGTPQGFIAESAPMQPILDMVRQVAPSMANILILGENGSGKGLIARLIHDCSLRRRGPFIAVNMGGLPEGLFESELFGHVKGAFTDAKADRAGRFELARGGTLFLDEIGNIPLGQQAKLLRLLETGEFERVGSSRTQQADVRLVAATNAVLQEEVAAGRFREDLFYRLNTVTIELPPLRERQEDILPLATFFLERHKSKYRKKLDGFSPQAEQLLRQHSWPGNVRELDHAVERAVLMAREELIGCADLGLNNSLVSTAPPLAGFASMTLEEVEKFMIQKALQQHEGNISEAARQLGLSRATLYRRLQTMEL